MKYLEFHPLSNVYPMVGGLEWRIDSDGRPSVIPEEGTRGQKMWDEFVASINRVGLLTPIVTWDGKIIDGRNRYIACLEAGVTPRTIELKDLCEDWDTLTDDQKRERAERVTYDANKKRAHYNDIMVALISLPILVKQLENEGYDFDAHADFAPGCIIPHLSRYSSQEVKAAYEGAAARAGVTKSLLNDAVRLVSFYGDRVADRIVGGDAHAKTAKNNVATIRRDPSVADSKPARLAALLTIERMKVSNRALAAAAEAKKRAAARKERDKLAKLRSGSPVARQAHVKDVIDQANKLMASAAEMLELVPVRMKDADYDTLDVTWRADLLRMHNELLEKLSGLPWGPAKGDNDVE